MKLLLSDYQKLLDLVDGKKPVWSSIELNRCCVKYGLITPTGNFLTIAGERKVQRLREALKQLREGVSLETGRIDRSIAIYDETWFRAKLDGMLCWFNEHCVFANKPPDTINPIRISDENSQLLRLRSEIIPIFNSASLIKLVSIALQKNALVSLETICLAEVVGLTKPNPTILRIQTKYYDYIMNTWPDCTWWHLTTNLSSLVMVKSHAPSLRNGIVAAVVPVKTVNWQSPRIDLSASPFVPIKEKPCQSTVKTKSKTRGRPRKARELPKSSRSRKENTTALQNAEM